MEGTSCVRGACVCPYGHHSNWEKTKCLKNVELNEPCSNHDECIAESSICYTTCRCRTSHVVSKDAKRCLPLATTLYQNCQEDSQCAQISNSCCGKNGTCICGPGLHDVNSVRITEDSFKDEQSVNFQVHLNFFQRCYASARLRDRCEDDFNCVIAHSSCVENRCTCDEDFHENRGKFCSNADRVQISILCLFILSFVRLINLDPM